MSKYYCSGCKKTVERDSDKPRIKSFCETAGKNVFIVKVATVKVPRATRDVPPKKKKETITVQQYRALKKPKRSNKFGNKIIKTPEGTFASKWEHEYWGILKVLARAGKIKHLAKQIKYPLRVNGVHITDYIADFVYEDNGKTIVVDTKSKATVKLSEFQMKKKLMLALFGIDVNVVFKKK